MRIIFSILIVYILGGCSNQIRVYTDHDPDYTLSNYSSFNWGQRVDVEKGKNPLVYNELTDKRIKTAVEEQLASHGYMITSSDPDLIVHYHIVIDDQTVVTTEPLGYSYGPYWVRMHTDVYPYREGTLIVDMMDAKTNALVWRGWAVSPLDEEYSAERTDKMIRTAVAGIFKKFP